MNTTGHKTHHGSSLTLLWRSSFNLETKIFIGINELLKLSTVLGQVTTGKKILFLKQEKLSLPNFEKVLEELQGKGVTASIMELPDGEAGKSSNSLLAIWEELQKLQFTRQDTICAIGGGALTDIGGFAAATYLRGVNFIVVPTTLLAQVDAAIGGKNGINLAAGKNLAGSYYFAKAILIDTSLLATLPQRQFISGLAEIIKYGLLEETIESETEYKKGPQPLLTFLEECLDSHFNSDHPSLPGIILSCIKMKLAVVAADPFEKGLRRSLNLGHTLGHALEAVSDFQLSHGEAVAIGLVFAAHISTQKKQISEGEKERLVTLLQKTGLPVEIPVEVTADKLIAAMWQDKKREEDSIRMILPKNHLGLVDYNAKLNKAEIEGLLAELL